MIAEAFDARLDLLLRLKCLTCGKVQYPTFERATFAAVFLGAAFGSRMGVYRCAGYECFGVYVRPWHLHTARKKNPETRRRQRRAHRARLRQCKAEAVIADAPPRT